MDILRQLRRDLADIGDANFELIVFELVRLQYPQAKKLDNPDGGADIIVPLPGGAKPLVFQAKHFPEHISWSKCRASLDAAVRIHDPQSVTFCFPRDLTQPQRAKFKEELVVRHEGVAVDYWGVSDFRVRLEEAPEIAGRFFDRIRNDALRSAQRAIGQGGKPLDNGLDIVQRASELARFADELDPHFRQQLMTGATRDFREPAGWDEQPYMTVKVADGDRTVRLDFWPRPGAEVAPGSWGFQDTEEGRQALDDARTALARGEEANVTEAIRLVIQQPVVVRDLNKEIGATEFVSELTIQPGEATPLRFEIETSNETITETIDVRPVLPRRPGCADFVGIDGGLRVELEFELLEYPTIRLTTNFSGSFGSSARDNLRAATALDAFARNTEIRLLAPHLLPEEGMVETGARLTDESARVAAFIRQLSENIVAIEQHVGFELEVPDRPKQEDVQTIANVASWLRGEEGSATVNDMTFRFTPAELAQHLDGLAKGEAVASLPVEQTIFGRVVPIGLIEMRLPPMKVIETRPTSNHPSAPISVRVVPAIEDASRPFKLLPGGRLTRVLVPSMTVVANQPSTLITVPKPDEAFGVVASALTRPQP